MQPRLIYILLSLAFQHAYSQTVPDLPITKDAAHLGDVRASLATTVGKAIESGPSDALYFTGKYFIRTSFKMPLISHITYFRVTDTARFMNFNKSRDDDGAESVMVVLTANEIESLLGQHVVDSSGAKHSWKRLKEGRWERSDGARAAINRGGKLFIVATKEEWPNLILDSVK